MIERARRMIVVAILAPFGIAAADGLMAGIAEAQGTSEQQMACQSDAFRLCGQYIPDVTSVRACMVRQIRNLSPACRSEFVEGRNAASAASDPSVDRHRPQ